MTMWARTQSGNLVNLDNVVAVQKKEDRNSKQFAVLAFDASEDGSWILAKRLSEYEADQLLGRLFSAPDDTGFDVGMVR